MGKLPTQTYTDILPKKTDFEYLRGKLKLKQFEEQNRFHKKFPKVKKFLDDRGLELGKIREHSAKLIGAGIVAGTLLLADTSNIKALPVPSELIETFKLKNDTDDAVNSNFAGIIRSIIPKKPRPLERNEEKILEAVFDDVLKVKTKANLEGEHLNTTYGYIGAEQHLRRYPGDTLALHGDGDVLTEGIAPGLGAWGYFANSRDGLSADLVEKEKWYAVVQTLYLPDWNRRASYLREWYKYRKVLIVNTENGNAIVAAIADSGPAAWTGKHFGGSAEVMDYLGGKRYKKGPVVLFFVDDPENKMPLGPVNYGSL